MTPSRTSVFHPHCCNSTEVLFSSGYSPPKIFGPLSVFEGGPFLMVQIWFISKIKNLIII